MDVRGKILNLAMLYYFLKPNMDNIIIVWYEDSIVTGYRRVRARCLHLVSGNDTNQTWEYVLLKFRVTEASPLY